MKDVHDRFQAFMNTFQYCYVVTMNYEKLIANKKPRTQPVHMLAPYKQCGGNIGQTRMEPDFKHDRVFNLDVVKPRVTLTLYNHL